MRLKHFISTSIVAAMAAGIMPATAAIELLAGHHGNRTVGWDTNHVGVIAPLNGEANAGNYFSGTQLTRDGAETSTDLSWGTFGSDAPTSVDGIPGGSLNNRTTVFTQTVFMAVGNNSFGSNLVLNAVHFDINRGQTDVPAQFKLEYLGGDLGTPITVYELTVETNEFMSAGVDASGDFDDLDWTLATEGTQTGTAASPTFNAMGDVELAFGETAQFGLIVIGETNTSNSLNLDNFAITGEFVEAPLPPKNFVTGTRIDTDFAATDSPVYADGDLDGQNGWAAITNSGANAFNVDSTGDGFAETISVSNSFDTTLGNQVVFDDGDQWTTNGIGSQWSGTIAFSFQTGSGTNLVKSREIAAGVTNTIEVADLNNRRVLNLGLTTNPDSVFAQGELDDVNINFHINGGKGLAVTFGGAGFGDNQMNLVGRADLGWDPEWEASGEDGFATAGPDYDSDLMVCDYVIRKTTIADTYLAVVDVTVGGTTYQGKPILLEKLVPYASDGLKFALGHDHESDIDGTFSRVDVAIDSLSMTHAVSADPLALPPFNMAVDGGDLSALVSWEGAYEADSVELFRSEVDGAGPYTSLTNDLVFSYGDEGLTDKRTYFYTTIAHYSGGDSPRSEQAILRALGKTALMEWGHATDIVNAHLNYAGCNLRDPAAVATNGIANYVSDGFDDSLVEDAVVYNTNNYPLVYGIMQHNLPGGVIDQNTDRWSNVHKFRDDAAGDYIKIDALNAALDAYSALLWVEGASVDATAAQTTWEVDANNAWNGNGLRAAVRNGSTWYVSETTFNSGGTASIVDIASEKWAVLTPATLTSTSMMTVSGASFIIRTLDNITAVGAFGDTQTGAADKNLLYFGLLQKTALTAFEQWTDSQGIYNDDAGMADDPDSDDASNLEEWGLGGNPMNAADVGIKERYMDCDGASITYIYPRLKSADRPNYTVLETTDLVNIGWGDNESAYTITSGGDWPGRGVLFEAVTNVIPVDVDTKFLKLEISE
ncbi:hypothetical protein PDESU_01854 [Pontiella desulfatans]|uniref:Fibronectin type-III domain-containing protein n=1 Tax=Pontiella desulfatans TaxID=2750659 RepID=A0A6C2U001_PONDE|nr:hypothetical protein [Pontiella desulfatans]VGO13298.1 hypothetical protein PDESU_01854 [Pontiella desulfatans]